MKADYTWLYELEMIRRHYGDRKAERSGVPLINHIHEGLKVLHYLDVPTIVHRAYCLHPLLQADADLAEFSDNEYMRRGDCDARVVMLAMEYRNQANAWLSNKVYWLDEWDPMETKIVSRDLVCDGEPTAGPLRYVKAMLLADKVQNFKDFCCYHDDHDRHDELRLYFKTWLIALGVESDAQLATLIECMDPLLDLEPLFQ